MFRTVRRTRVWLVAALAGVVLLGGCSIGSDSDDLNDTEWELITLGGSAALDGVVVTVEFAEDDGLFGSGGCNRFTGAWDGGEDNALSISPGPMTLVGCDEDVAGQEQAFIAALEGTASFEIDDDVLTLLNADGNELATMGKLESSSLEDTEWQMTYYNDGQGALLQALDDTAVHATFHDDGSMTGSAGCNTFTTTYETDGDDITIQPAATTRMACDQPVMDQEFAFLQALERATVHDLGSGTLTLRTADDEQLATFVATE